MSLITFTEQARGRIWDFGHSGQTLASWPPHSQNHPTVFQVLHDMKFSVFQILCDMKFLVLIVLDTYCSKSLQGRYSQSHHLLV